MHRYNDPAHVRVQEGGSAPPPRPSVFIKPSASVDGDLEDIAIPKITQDGFLDYEGELAIVIGKSGKDISRDKALSHVSGCFAANDLSSRACQRDPHKAGGVPQMDIFAFLANYVLYLMHPIPAYGAELDVVLVPLLAPLAVVVFGRVLELVLDGDPALALVAVRPGDRVRLLVLVLEDGLEHDLVALGDLVARSVDQVPVPVLGQAHGEVPVLVYGRHPLGELVRLDVLVHAPVVKPQGALVHLYLISLIPKASFRD
ncbi:uncharacterized protein NECHADRAFT_88824 [Fusarium vanettenii 77-13-4]|uniref:Fumarylacetoacetase-like C-terminal domain-containing protein n=1 Tax=Fusarium vanettenii (strain ATCC MYA-4622 / CBS 123669 / FGSC 9596 / NRRL 45880 / 77-13-4) TaxID=660122 RepID=C7ZQ19_FUSV7|nr:uncharacterized protein NECHADRAFT_88824 [Fusarium vanettenii 77-13-4]EEU33896.1 hypothetical protein NECHADRAFT_88824 [Fusarium vanettenii 77-13-4]